MRVAVADRPFGPVQGSWVTCSGYTVFTLSKKPERCISESTPSWAEMRQNRSTSVWSAKQSTVLDFNAPRGLACPAIRVRHLISPGKDVIV